MRFRGNVVWGSLLWGIMLGCQFQSSPPKPSLAGYSLPAGLRLDLVASEPLIRAPVAMDFDDQGRMWVVEMPGYMANIDGQQETDPSGRILILEDQDKDGYRETVQVFLDSLILPRAIALVYGGLLYAEPPNLWFVDITPDDRPGQRTLVDSTYVFAGNVEHQPNGLVWNIDNWIYSAKSNFRYRREKGKWIRDFTAFRGQWGMTHDDQGHLYYNNNSVLLLGDQTLPQAPLQNPFLRPRFTLNQLLSPTQQVYPAHPTSVNRGYQAGVLDSLGRLKRASSACGPLIYRGAALGERFAGNAFTAVPEGNLVKRMILDRTEGRTKATFSNQATEFLRSTDPAFRPVNLNNGPDGALYIVDMHRGIIQHRAYMTNYLREQILAQEFDTIQHQGRILAIRPEITVSTPPPPLDKLSNQALIDLLSHPNGWLRDRAQHMLVAREAKEIIPTLQQLLQETSFPVALHAFWTLEGLNALSPEILASALSHPTPAVVHAGLYVIGTNQKDNPILLENLPWQALLNQLDIDLSRYLSLALPHLITDTDSLFAQLAAIGNTYPEDSILQTLVLSGLVGQEAAWRDFLSETTSSLSPHWFKANEQVLQARAKDQPNPALVGKRPQTDPRTRGLALYQRYCSSCHGLDGGGQTNLAPALVNATYVSGPVQQLGLILLYGLRGPLHRGEEVYEFAAHMPGLAQNSDLSNQDLAHIMAFVRSAFTTLPFEPSIKPAMLDSLRQLPWPAGQSLTEPELQALWTGQMGDAH